MPTVFRWKKNSIEPTWYRLATPSGRRGLTLLFLPLCSPELNRIEVLWHRCKHYRGHPEDYHTDESLWQCVEHGLNRVGNDCTITFA